MSKRTHTAPFVVEKYVNGKWRASSYELSEKMARQAVARAGCEARYYDNMDYEPSAPRADQTVDDLLADLEQRTRAGKYIIDRVYLRRATAREREAVARFIQLHPEL